MNTKTILPIAIMLSLPLMANAANISGDMYTAPAAADTNHPAPTTNVSAPYGRANIDTTDQEHIATTAYVKGAYNSAIAAVNKVDSDKQGKLMNMESSPHVISNNVISSSQVSGLAPELPNMSSNEYSQFMSEYYGTHADNALITAGAVFDMTRDLQPRLFTTQEQPVSPVVLEGTDLDSVAVSAAVGDMVSAESALNSIDNDTLVTAYAVALAFRNMGYNLNEKIDSKRVEIYTTWDTNAKTQVPFVTAQ